MNKGTPLLSVIIPVYNTSKFLSRCLDSVLEQTYPEIEIIVVNDASPDNSEEIILDYARRHDNLIYVKNDINEGLFQARLRGYEKARGAYIASLDSDDFVGFDYYRIQMMKALESSADIVISNMSIYYQSSGKKQQRTYGNYAIRGIDLYDKEIESAFFSMDAEVSQWWFVWNKVYKKELWERCYAILSAYEGHHIMLEDFVYGSIFMTHAKHVVSIENDSYYYVRHEASSTGSGGGAAKIKKNVNDILDAFAFLNQYFTEEYKTEEGLRFLDKACRRWKKTWIKSTAAANISEEDRKEIISKLEEIPVEVDTDQHDDVYEKYFYRELNSCSDENKKIKERLRDPKIKLLCVETEDLLIKGAWDLEGLLKNVERKWSKSNSEDISEVLFLRKRKEQMVLSSAAETCKHGKKSLEELYEGIKKQGMEEFNQLVDKVKKVEEEINQSYFFVQERMAEVISFATWLGKKVVLINTSGMHSEIMKKYYVYTPDKEKDMVQELCDAFGCRAFEIMYLGTDKYISLSELRRQYGIRCHKTDSSQDVKQRAILNGDLKGNFMLHSGKAGNSNGIREVLEDFINQKTACVSMKDSMFASNPYIIGAVIGSHVISVIGWIFYVAKEKGKSHICFWGNDANIYYQTIKYALENKKISDDITVSSYLFSAVEETLRWIVYPESFAEQTVGGDFVSVLELFKAIGIHMEESILFKYGIQAEEIIDNYELCERLHFILMYDFDLISELEKKFSAPLDEKTLIVYGNKSEEQVIKKYAAEGAAFASIYQGGQDFLPDRESYYSKGEISDYSVRTFFMRNVFSVNKSTQYLERFVLENIKKGIFHFTDLYFDLFQKDFLDYLPIYSEDDSYYYEMFLRCPQNNDRLLFDAVERYDYKSKKWRLLSNIWWSELKGQGLIKEKDADEKKAIDISGDMQKKTAIDEAAVYYKGKKMSLEQMSKYERQLVYWIFDKREINYKVQKYPLSRIFLRPFLSIAGRRIKPEKHCLYIATSNYNLLCCIIHKLKYNADKECDLILSVWRKDKVKVLKEGGIFKDIYFSEDNHFRALTWSLDKRIEHASDKEKDYLVEGFYDRFFEEIPVNLFDYKNILATNTIMPITVLLQKLHLSYDCVEEAAGLYSNNELLMNNMRNFHPKSEVYALKKYKMLNMDYVKGKRFVNVSAQEPGYSKKNIVDFNVISELKKMDKEKRAKVLRVFSSVEAESGESKAACLMLTYPLSGRCGLTEREHIEVYSLLMDIFCKDMAVHFKPHPDDKVDYDKYFGNEADFRLINRQILSELLEFETKTNYQKAITTVSTSTNNLQNCEKKIVFGKEFEESYKYLLLYYGCYLTIKELCQKENYIIYQQGVDEEIFRNIFHYSDALNENYSFADTYENIAKECSRKILLLNGNVDYSVIKAEDIVLVQNFGIQDGSIPETHFVTRMIMNIKGRERDNRYTFQILLPKNLRRDSEIEIWEILPRTNYQIFIGEDKLREEQS